MMTIAQSVPVDARSGHEPTYASCEVFVIVKNCVVHRVQCFAHLETGEFYTIAVCGRRFTTTDKPHLTSLVNLDCRCHECWVKYT